RRSVPASARRALRYVRVARARCDRGRRTYLRARGARIVGRVTHVIDRADVTAWLVTQIARELHLDATAIDVNKPIAVLGLDSLTVATLTADLEDRFGRSLPETILRHDLTIATLSGIVAEGADAGPPAAETKPAVAGASAATPACVEWTTSQR